MELVDQQGFLQIAVLAVVCLCAGFHSVAHREEFQVMESDFCQTVVPLDVVLVGQGAAVQLQIQLAAEGVRVVDVGFQLLHEAADGGVLGLGAALQILAAPCHFHHFILGSAAAVTEAIGNQLPVRHILLTDGVGALGAVYILIEVLGSRPDVGFVQVREHAGAVQALPVEGVIGELVGVVPGHLGGQEVFHAAALHDLGNSGGVTEGIRQPEGVGGKAEVFPGEPLAPQELAHHGFAGGDVAVAFHPNAAVGLIAALCHLFLNPLEQLGIVAADHFAVESGALHKGVLGILLHQVQLVGVGAGALLDGFAHMPQPGGVHMGVADDAYGRSGGAVVACQGGRHDLLTLFQCRIEFLAADALGVIVQHFVESQHHIDELCLAVAGFIQHFHQLGEGAEIEIEIGDLVVFDADFHGAEGEAEVAVIRFFQGHTAHHIVTGIEFQINVDFLSGLGLFHQHIAVVVAVAGHNDFCGKGAEGFSVHPQHGFIAADSGPQEQRPSCILLGHGIAGFEPAVGAFPAPDISGLDGGKQAVLRDGVQRFAGLVSGNRQVTDLLENSSVQGVFKALQLSDHPLDLLVIQHGFPSFQNNRF